MRAFSLCMFALLASAIITANAQDPINQPFPYKIEKSKDGISIDVGEVNKGDTIKVCAKIRNYGKARVHVHQIVPSGYAGHPINMFLEPGEEKLAMLIIHTANFKGPIQTTRSLVCEPECTIDVELFLGCDESKLSKD